MDFMKDLSIDKVRNLASDAFNQVKPKNDVEVRVYEVLSHKNWGASTTLMNEIAQDTFDYERFLIVTKLMWEAIETPRPAAWRVIFKGLTLLEHLVKNGSERCVDDARNHSHLLRNLDKFNYYEGTVDRGVGVREKSKQIVDILQDDERIREERQKARQLREKFAGRSVSASNSAGGGGGGAKYPGYGNSDANWQSGGGGGGSGYGNDGIGSSGRANPSNDRGYSGRYGEGGADGGTPSFSKSPAATQPKKSSKAASGATKAKKMKKKEKKAMATIAATAPAAAAVDLFGFDDAPAPASDDSSFDAFQTGGPAPVAPVLAAPPAPAASNDDFGDFQQIAPKSEVQFDAFGSAPATQPQQTFDAFGGIQQQQQPSMNAVSNSFGNVSMQSPPTGMMSAPAAATPAAAAPADNDDFGDFEGAAGDPFSGKSPKKAGDPLSKLISLDGLSKNVKKETKSSSGGPLGGDGGGQSQPGFLTMGGPPILGTGQEGDIGEVFGQVLASGNRQQQMMKQQQGGMGGMGMNAGNNMGMMGGQPMNQGMMGGQQQQQGMMNNTMMRNSGGGMMGGQMSQQGNMGMMSGQMPQQGNMGMMSGQMPQQGNMGMMGGGMGMGGQQGAMQGNMGMMGGQGQMQGQMNMMGQQGQMNQMNMMGGNAMGGGGMGMMGGQNGQGFR